MLYSYPTLVNAWLRIFIFADYLLPWVKTHATILASLRDFSFYTKPPVRRSVFRYVCTALTLVSRRGFINLASPDAFHFPVAEINQAFKCSTAILLLSMHGFAFLFSRTIYYRGLKPTLPYWRPSGTFLFTQNHLLGVASFATSVLLSHSSLDVGL